VRIDNPLFPALRSSPTAVSGASRQKQIPSSQSYAGELVFTAFSGSHQDAIKKGLDRRAKETQEDPETAWGVPYLTIDPQDIGRSYEAIIRINSQSGKGDVAYVWDREHGFDLPKSMHPIVGKYIYDLADQHGRELTPDEIRVAFFEHFVNVQSHLRVSEYELIHKAGGSNVHCKAVVSIEGHLHQIEGDGNGPINSFVHALETAGMKDFKVTDYRSHAVQGGSDAIAAAYVQLQHEDGRLLCVWGQESGYNILIVPRRSVWVQTACGCTSRLMSSPDWRAARISSKSSCRRSQKPGVAQGQSHCGACAVTRYLRGTALRVREDLGADGGAVVLPVDESGKEQPSVQPPFLMLAALLPAPFRHGRQAPWP